MKTLIACVIACCCVVHCASAESAGLVDDLSDLIREMRRDLAAIDDPAKWRTRAQDWIHEIESTIDENHSESGVIFALGALAGLYTNTGQPQQALEVYDEVLASTEIPGVLLRTMLDAAAASLLSGYAVEDALPYTDDFAALIEKYRANEVEYPSGFDVQYERIELTRAELLTAAADWLIIEHGDMSAQEIAELVGPLLVEAASHAEMYQQAQGEWADADSLAGAAMRRAQSLARAAALYETAGEAVLARDLHNGATQTLEAMFEAYPDTRYTQDASTLLLGEVFQLAGSMQQYIAYATLLASLLPPGPEFITHLRSEAWDFANDPLRLNDRSLLQASTQLFDLVLALEKQWYGNEYTTHVNYQWALLGSAKNALNLDDLNGAAKRLEELRKLDLQGDYFVDLMARLEATYAQRLEQSIAKDTVSEPATALGAQNNEDNQVDSRVPQQPEAIGQATNAPKPVQAPAKANGDTASFRAEDVPSPTRVNMLTVLACVLTGCAGVGLLFLIFRRAK